MSKKLLKVVLVIMVTLVLHCQSAYATDFCPAVNQLTANQSFWTCMAAGYCKGDANFIGAALIPDRNGKFKYFCAYNTDIRAALISTDSFAIPMKITLKGRWQWSEAYHQFRCITNNPNDCPIPAGVASVNKIGDLLKPVLVVFFEVFLGYWLISSIMRWRKARAVKCWATTEGVIIKSELISRLGAGNVQITESWQRYMLDIIYQYEVYGKSYQGKQIYISLLGGKEVLSAEAANAYLQKYPRNTKVLVYYNRNNPQESVVEAQHKYGVKAYIVFTILAFLLFQLTHFILSNGFTGLH